MEGNTFKDTTINDYLPKLYEDFPDIPKQDIRKIVEFGWRLIYIAIICGCDVLISSQTNNFWMYIGSLTKDSLRHFFYYKNKLLRKFRFMYKRLKPETDEYYYCWLSQTEYEQFVKDTTKRGRKKRNFLFENKVVFKYLCTSKVDCFNKAIIKFKPSCDLGYSFYYKNLECRDPILVRPPIEHATMQDILVENNDYELL